MRKLLSTTAIAAAFGAIAFGAQAQTSSDANMEQQTAAGPADRCDSDWRLVDEDSNGFVTREEATGLLKDLFTLMDSNRNGEITKTEYVDCIAQTSDGAQSAEAMRDEESFAAVDADQDGSVDAEEFRTVAEQAYDDSRSVSDAEAEPVVMLRRFVWLTPDELSSSAYQDMSADEAAWRSLQTFQGLDTDGDGILSNEEWAQAQITPGPTEPAIASRFERLDIDASGSVSEQEYEQAQTAMLDRIETGSVSGMAGDDTEASASSGSSAGADGVPVFAYRFMGL